MPSLVMSSVESVAASVGIAGTSDDASLGVTSASIAAAPSRSDPPSSRAAGPPAGEQERVIAPARVVSHRRIRGAETCRCLGPSSPCSNAEHALVLVIAHCDNAFTRLEDSFPDPNGAVIGSADGSAKSPSMDGWGRRRWWGGKIPAQNDARDASVLEFSPARWKKTRKTRSLTARRRAPRCGVASCPRRLLRVTGRRHHAVHRSEPRSGVGRQQTAASRRRIAFVLFAMWTLPHEFALAEAVGHTAAIVPIDHRGNVAGRTPGFGNATA